jgi:type IV pilus assembly protein PilM
LACEIVPEGVIAARRQAGSGLLASAAFAAFGPHAPTAAFAPYLDKDAPRVGLPGVQTGNPQERDAVVQCVRRALESVGGRNGVVTLVVPDQAVRVLMMDFDSLPSKAADAVPLLRFRLKKMVPFDVDDAAVSYQTLPAKTGARAVVAIIPNAVLREYETVVREAGFEPGIVLPSTLACLGMVTDGETALVVHSSTQCVTTAITGGQELLLHRTQELPWAQEQLAQTMNPAEVHGTYSGPETMPLVADESVTNVELGERIDELRYPEIMAGTQEEAPYEFVVEREDDTVVAKDETEALLMPEPIATEFQPFEPQTFEPAAEPQTLELQSAEDQRAEPDPVQTELHHAMAVAAAYFEDSTGRAPDPVLVAGALDARSWTSLMRDGSLNVRDLVSLEDMGTAIDSGLSRAQLGAVCGALRG